MVKETTEWKRHVEANSSLMKRFEESRVELEKVLKIARSSMTERGNPEELLKKHTVRNETQLSILVLANRPKTEFELYLVSRRKLVHRNLKADMIS